MNPDFSVEKLGVCRSINACWGGDPAHCAGNLGLRRNILRCAQFKGRRAWNNANGRRRPAHKGENYELKCNRSESRHHAEGRPFAPGTYSWVPDRISYRSGHRPTLSPSGAINPELFWGIRRNTSNQHTLRKAHTVFPKSRNNGLKQRNSLIEPSLQSRLPSPSGS